jgi:hypothetical protein
MNTGASFANMFVGAKHSGSKSLAITNKLSAGMLRPLQNRDAPDQYNIEETARAVS